jgi:beta-galactosidase
MIGRYYREIENIHVNTEKPRAYFIPFDSDSEFSEKRENSGRFTLLNGEWDFKYYENIEEIDLEDKKIPR